MKSGILVVLLVLASCSGAPPRFDSIPSVICEDYVGRGWSTLSAPPVNSEQLVGLLDRPGLEAKSALWFRRSGETTAVCFYGSSVCDSEAHVFRKTEAGWEVDNSDVAEWICVA